MLGLVNDLLLETKSLGMGFLLKALYELCLCFFRCQTGDFFQSPGMFFLVFFQLRLFKVYNLNLAVQILFYCIIVLDLAFQLFCFLIQSLFLLYLRPPTFKKV